MIERLEVTPGAGTVIRFGGIVAWADPSASAALISFLAQSARNLSPSPRGGRQIADHIAGVLASRDPEPHVAFAVIGPSDHGWASLLHGPVQAWDGARWLAPTPTPGWLQAIITPRPAITVSAAGTPTPAPEPDAMWDLEAGVVPGSGFVLIPSGVPGRYAMVRPPLEDHLQYQRDVMALDAGPAPAPEADDGAEAPVEPVVAVTTALPAVEPTQLLGSVATGPESPGAGPASGAEGGAAAVAAGAALGAAALRARDRDELDGSAAGGDNGSAEDLPGGEAATAAVAAIGVEEATRARTGDAQSGRGRAGDPDDGSEPGAAEDGGAGVEPAAGNRPADAGAQPAPGSRPADEDGAQPAPEPQGGTPEPAEPGAAVPERAGEPGPDRQPASPAEAQPEPEEDPPALTLAPAALAVAAEPEPRPEEAGPAGDAGSAPPSPPRPPPVPGPAGSVDLRTVATTAGAPLPRGGGPDQRVPGAPVVAGALCARGHLNRPGLTVCARCRTLLPDGTRDQVSGTRPPLGALIADDGTIYRLDLGYLVGSAPGRDPTVGGGLARPLVLHGSDVSGSHAELRLADWDVLIVDRGSAAGTCVFEPGASEWARLNPFEPRTLTPGTHVAFGQRVVTFLSPWVTQS